MYMYSIVLKTFVIVFLLVNCVFLCKKITSVITGVFFRAPPERRVRYSIGLVRLSVHACVRVSLTPVSRSHNSKSF